MTTPQVHHHYHPTHTHHHHHHQTVRSGPVGSTRAPIESTPYPVTTPPGLIQPPTRANNVEETLEAGAPRRYGPGYSDGEYGSGGSSCGCDCGGPLSSCYGWVKSRCSSHSNTSRPVGGTRVPVGSTTRSVRARAISTSPSTAINDVQPTSEPYPKPLNINNKTILSLDVVNRVRSELHFNLLLDHQALRL